MTKAQRVGWGVTFLVVLVAAVVFGLLPGMVERSLNRIDGKPLLPISAHARRLHASLQIVDLHADTLMWQRNLVDKAKQGHVDLPRLEEGNVALQVFSSVTKTPKGQNYDANGADSDNITALVVAQAQPPRTWTSLVQRSLWHATKLDRQAARSNGALRKVTDPASLDALLAARQGKPTPVGALLSIEGLHDLEGKRENLDRLYAAGFRMASLTHFFDDELAGSMHGLKKGGLTPLGRQIVRAMEDKGMIVDIAHLSHAGVAEVLAMARRPVVSSHGGVQATCNVNRNLTDDEIRGVARTGGLVGIGYWDAAVCSTSPRAIARAMRHVRDLVGIDHVALGSDFDGATTTGFDTAHLEQVTQGLIEQGFSDDEIRALMGGNALRVLRQGLVPLHGSAR